MHVSTKVKEVRLRDLARRQLRSETGAPRRCPFKLRARRKHKSAIRFDSRGEVVWRKRTISPANARAIPTRGLGTAKGKFPWTLQFANGETLGAKDAFERSRTSRHSAGKSRLALRNRAWTHRAAGHRGSGVPSSASRCPPGTGRPGAASRANSCPQSRAESDSRDSRALTLTTTHAHNAHAKARAAAPRRQMQSGRRAAACQSVNPSPLGATLTRAFPSALRAARRLAGGAEIEARKSRDEGTRSGAPSSVSRQRRDQRHIART